MDNALLIMFLALVWAHTLLDYALQGDFVSKAKNFVSPISGVPPRLILFQHAFLQAGAVVYITGSLLLGIVELIAHYIIDSLKITNKISFYIDQFLHVLCKVIYILIIAKI